MSPYGLVFIISFLFGISLFVINAFLSRNEFNMTGSAKFSFRQYFPFELNPYRRNRSNSYIFPFLNIAGSLAILAASLMFVIESNTINGNIGPSIVFIVLVFIALVAFNALTFIKLSALKLHLAFVAIFLGATLLLNILYAFYFLNVNIKLIRDTKMVVRVIASIFALINVIILFVLMVNKNFKNWAKLVQLDAETYVRPKVSYLPVLEWGTFVVLLSSFIPLGIMMFL